VRHYLDHASTSSLRPEARDAMVHWLHEHAGDPGRIHREGLTTRAAVEEAREQVAALFGARPREVVFTSGATESIAAAVHGAAAWWTERHGTSPTMVVPRIEHSAVREASRRAAHVVWVGVDGRGRVDLDELLATIGPDTAIVHLQWANHEVGTRQPVHEVVAACRERDVLVHVDAASAAGRDPIDFGALGADLLSISAHKLGGPPGVGALLVRRGLRLPPLLLGGEQERARRAGMENVPAVAGFGAACDALTGSLTSEAATADRLTRRVLDAVARGVDAGLGDLTVYGDPDDRVPHLVCLGVGGVEPQAVLLGLDQAGVAAHSGSACASEGLEPSPVLEAMGVDAHRSLRVSVGWDSTDDAIDALLSALPPVLARLRALAAG
jgi:cysteine desulfurase